ncbi:MAG: ATP-dependent helicase, partial [Bacteroidota bacterium]
PPRAYEANEQLRQEDRLARRPHLHKIYMQYVIRCKRSGAMDFDDLLYRLYELLYKNPDGVLEKYREKFKYVLVDEFQDTNHLQYRIVQKLVNYPDSPRNVCVVGDDAQSIYAFRGATIQNILDFEKDYRKHGIQIFKLEQNYRSTNHIVQAANEVITFNKRQIQKTIRSEKGSGERIKLIKAHNDTEEGKRVADAILEQKNRNHLNNSDIAILYRTNSQSRVFEEHLRRYNIPYKVFGGQSFYQRKEVKDLIAYLRLAVNPNDDEALRRVINYPRRGIGATSIGKVAALANANDQTLWEALPKVDFPKRTKASVEKFRKLIDSFQQKASTQNAYQAADFIARHSGLVDTLKTDTTVEGANRLENFTALLDAVKEFVESDLEETTGYVEDKSLASYLQNIALLTDADTEEGSNDYVTLMSVHAAKGLEFASVFVVGLEENLFPSFMSKDSIEGTDEERRLFYVAITRAEAHLTLSYAESRVRHGRIQSNPPSRFLDEIEQGHFNAPPGRRTRKGGTFDTATGRPKAGVTGNFKRTARVAKPMVDPSTFQPSPSENIVVGNKVLHLQFGEGHVTKIDGHKEKRVATIVFPALEDGEKRIMLRFAKLQIVG